MLLDIKWYQFVRNDDVRRLTKQPKLTAIIQLRQLTLFGHIACIDDSTDAKRILLASPPVDWRRYHHLSASEATALRRYTNLIIIIITLAEAADLAPNRPLWQMMCSLKSCMP